jgi:hypothetical protein
MLQSKPVTKMNQSPLQYFTTPLPMKMIEFDKFLKENQIDVQSVTKPLTNVPQMVDLYPKPLKNNIDKPRKPLGTTEKPVSKMEVVVYDNMNVPYKVNVKSPRKLPHVLENAIDEDIVEITDATEDRRNKRYSQLINSRFYTVDPKYRVQLRKSKNRIFKKKIKIFDKKSTLSTNLGYMKYTLAKIPSEMETEVELTIISMDEIDDQSISKPHHKSEMRKNVSTTESIKEQKKTFIKTDKPTTSITAPKSKLARTEATATIKNKMHNKFFNIANKNRLLAAKLDASACRFDSIHTTTPDEIAKTSTELVGTEFFNKLNSKIHHPKRVRISSHSYKYDIIYDHKKNLDKKRNLKPRKSSSSYPYPTKWGWYNMFSSCFDKDSAFIFTTGRLPDVSLKLEWMLMTVNAAGTNSLTCLPKHGGARDNIQ